MSTVMQSVVAAVVPLLSAILAFLGIPVLEAAFHFAVVLVHSLLVDAKVELNVEPFVPYFHMAACAWAGFFGGRLCLRFGVSLVITFLLWPVAFFVIDYLMANKVVDLFIAGETIAFLRFPPDLASVAIGFLASLVVAPIIFAILFPQLCALTAFCAIRYAKFFVVTIPHAASALEIISFIFGGLVAAKFSRTSSQSAVLRYSNAVLFGAVVGAGAIACSLDQINAVLLGSGALFGGGLAAIGALFGEFF